MKVRKRAKIRNRYNQAPQLTQDTNGKVTTSQIDIANESKEVSPFPAGEHKASIHRDARKHYKQDKNNINDPQKKHRLGTVSKNNLLEGLNRFHGAPSSPLVQMWIKSLHLGDRVLDWCIQLLSKIFIDRDFVIIIYIP